QPSYGVNSCVVSLGVDNAENGCFIIKQLSSVIVNGMNADGSNPNALTIQYNESLSEPVNQYDGAIRIISSSNIQILNTKILGRFNPARTVGYDAISTLSLSGTGQCNFISIQQCIITRGRFGINQNGSTFSQPDKHWLIAMNRIGGAFVSQILAVPTNDIRDSLSSGGIHLSIIDSSTLQQNEVDGIMMTHQIIPSGIDNQTSGISAILATHMEIRGNRVNNIVWNRTDGSFALSSGIKLSGNLSFAFPGNNFIINNSISKINSLKNLSGNPNSTELVAGIRVSQDLNVNIIHNSVWISEPSNNNGINSCLSVQGDTINPAEAIVLNNVFVNSSTNGNGTVTVLYSTKNCYDFSNENNNVLYSPTGIIYPDAPNIEVWNSRCGHSQKSVSGDPAFVSSSDLHLANFGLSYANNLGVPNEFVANDIDGEMRSGTGPDAGCDENVTLQPLTDIQLFTINAGYMYGSPEGQPLNIIARGKNNGNSVELVTVIFSVLDSTGTDVFYGTFTTTAPPFEFFYATNSTPWSPSTFGILKSYKVLAISQHAADFVQSNDSTSKDHTVFPVFDGTNYSSTFESTAESEGWMGTGDWRLGEPQKLGGAHSGVNAWVTKLTDTYSPKQHSFLFSPYFNLSSNIYPKIQFSHSIRTEPSWDGSVFQYTTNMGATWEMMDNVGSPYSSNWYESSVYQNTDGNPNCFEQQNAVASDGSMFPLGPKWTSNGDCFEADTAISPFGYYTAFRRSDELSGTPLVQFRYWTFSDGSVVDSGWTFDDFSLVIDSGGSISGTKFEDINKNGAKDAGEPGLADWTINLQGPVVLSTQTDANGNYSFEYLPEGIYLVSESLKTGWVKTFPAYDFYNVSLFPGLMNVSTIDFGNFELGKIRLEVSIDVNGDGIIDSEDNAPLPAGTNSVCSVSRDTSFNFVTAVGNNTLGVWIGNLDPGTYSVEQTTLPSGWIQTTTNGASGITINTSGFVDTIRFMNFKKIAVSGIKFHDMNVNGTFDAGETGLPDWVISISSGTTVTTDPSGYYEFTNLGPGNYNIIETNQDGWLPSYPVSSGHSFTTFSGNNLPDLNFGNYKLGTISGMKFNDENNNGLKDNDESGIRNWKIILKGSFYDSTFTNADGYYEFHNLPLGNYKIHEVYQAGWQQTYPSFLRYFDTISTSDQTLTNRDFGNYQLPNSLSGMKFFDMDADGVKDSLEPGLENWKIKLFDSTLSLVAIDTTDTLGNYSFQNLPNGVYVIKEVLKNEWVQTHPRTVDVSTGYQPGVYILKLVNGISKTGLNFGNTIACRYIGPVGGSWRDPANWSCGHPPDAGTPIIIPQDTSVVIDSLPSDSIHSVRIQRGGRILFSALNRLLRIQGRIQIDSGGTLSFEGNGQNSLNNLTSGLVLYGDWINNGTFNPGQSTIIFSGDSAKTIVAGDIVNESEATLFDGKTRKPSDYTSNSFFNLIIDGENTNLIGNMRIQNSLALYKSLNTRVEDTVTIENASPDAIDSTGLLPRGSIKRVVDKVSGGTYRFESASSTLSFSAGDELPDTVLMTTLPDTTTDAFNLQWKVVGGTLDTANNTLTADSIGKFSKWVVGKPSAGFRKSSGSVFEFGTPTVSRLYSIVTSGGGVFNSTLRLRYEDSELFENESQGALQLLQGPVVADTMRQNWNMISVPVLPETTSEVTALFPSAVSNAFKFVTNNGYTPESSLTMGIGYWLKFPAYEYVGILGDEQRALTVNVDSGWNIIGTISFPLAASSVIDTAGAEISGLFYGYSNGYEIVDTLRAMRGYWIKATNNGSITLQGGSSGNNKVSSAFSILQTLQKLTLTDNEGNRQLLFFGTLTEVDELLFDLPPTPPVGLFDIRFSNGSVAFINNLDIVRELPIQISSAVYPMTISWDMKNQFLSHTELLIDKNIIPLSGKGNTTITSPNVMLRIHPSAVTMVPLEFILHQNYPNPFNPTTTIRFEIALEGKVTLRIYNVLGQVVNTLVDNELLRAGIYARKLNNTSLPTGVYYYRISVLDGKSPNETILFQDQRKMILLK
ncbi:MAG: T9SS type A sorting domain-containing protein, partial [Ignavibacteriae bacterium]|nr:T9SS type A sorting domain-containing protein [Ignavibacteriota bacterium]